MTAAGDQLIRQFTVRLGKAIRRSDLAVRLGGMYGSFGWLAHLRASFKCRP
jgi:hypothetical protein